MWHPCFFINYALAYNLSGQEYQREFREYQRELAALPQCQCAYHYQSDLDFKYWPRPAQRGDDGAGSKPIPTTG